MPSPLDWNRKSGRSGEILNVRAEVEKHRTRLATVVEDVTEYLTSPTLLLGLLGLHVAWIAINIEPVAAFLGMAPFDPFPFMLLATVASVEAPLLAVLILMGQMRNAHIEELRQEVNLQVNLHVEREITELFQLVREIQSKLQIESRLEDWKLKQMESELNPRELLEDVRQELTKAEKHTKVTEA
jgi:uncharacterized membrane protein